MSGNQGNHDLADLLTVSDDLPTLLAAMMQAVGDAVIHVDELQRIQWMNSVAERMTGWTYDQARGQTLAEVCPLHSDFEDRVEASLVAAAFAAGAVVRRVGHVKLRRLDGTVLDVEDAAAPLRSKANMDRAIVVLRDLTERNRLAYEMSYRAIRDELTGTLNRVEFEHRLRETVRRARGDGTCHALLMIDLDQFKLINDSAGHAFGDQTLKQVAVLLAESIAAGDTLARLGADEFGIILESRTADQALVLANQIRDKLDQHRFVAGKRRVRVGVSIGLVNICDNWPTITEVMQAADQACFAAKAAGRNRVFVWQASDRAVASMASEAEWANKVEQAIDEDRFAIYLQRIVPIAPVDDEGIRGEILLRMLDDNDKPIAPGLFLPAAERYHLAPRLDRWVLWQVIGWLAASKEHEVSSLSVNLSGQTVGDAVFHESCIERLGSLPPAKLAKLCLEITETAAITNIASASSFVNRVRAMGVKVALDDFGAGSSSFGYLKDLRVDSIKIDGQFIKDVLTDPLDRVAVMSFVGAAKVLGLATVAEYVDNADVLLELANIGVDYAQGFHLHKPEHLFTPKPRRPANLRRSSDFGTAMVNPLTPPV